MLHLGPVHLSDMFAIMLGVRWVVASLGFSPNGLMLYLDPPKPLAGGYSVRAGPILPQRGGSTIYWFCESMSMP